MASNMDGVGTSSMAKALQKYKMMTGLLENITHMQDWKYAMGTGIELKYITPACVGTGAEWDDNVRLPQPKQVMTSYDRQQLQ